MTTVTLYELADLRDLIDSALEASGGELTPEIEEALTAWDESFANKAERVALYVCEQDALAGAAKEEADRLYGLAAIRQRKVASLKRYLLAQMERVGKTKIDGVLKTIAIQKNPASVTGETVRPLDALYIDVPEFVRYSPASFALDRKAIIEAHKAGKPIPDGLAVTQTVGVRIR